MEDNEIKEKGTTTISFKELFWIFVGHWYWFAIALLLTCGYAVYYIMKTPKVYESTAAIIVKDNQGASPDVSEAFSDIGLLNTSVNINNELVQIKSPIIVNEVVERLGLDVEYRVKDGLRPNLLYDKDLPITVNFVDIAPDRRAQLIAKYNGDGTIELGPFAQGMDELDDQSDKHNMTINLSEQQNDTLASPIGRLIVKENPAYLGMKDDKIEIHVDHIGNVNASRKVQASLRTEVLDNYSSVIHIYAQDINVLRARDILQGVIDVYNDNWIDDRNQISVATSKFIDERLAVIENELGSVDSDISSFKAEHHITDVGAVGTAYFQRSLEASDEVAGLRNTLDLARQVRDHLTNIVNSHEVLPATTGLNNIGIESQIQAYNTALVNRNNLVANSSELNPLVERVDVELNGMRQAILSAIDSYITTLNAEIRGKQAQQTASASRMSAAPSQARHLLGFERQQKVKESLYLYLLQKREENELSQAFSAYNTKVVMPPSVSAPVSPQPRKILAIAIVIGLIIPGGILFLVEILNTKVRGRRDIESLTLPFVGEIPSATQKRTRFQKFFGIRPKAQKDTGIIVRRGNRNILNEAFRVARTNLEFLSPDKGNGKARVIMLTSANPGSGKTFVAANLGSVLALKDKRVALLDLDMRKATLSKLAGSPSKGLTNYLVGTATPDEIVVRDLDGAEGVDLYPVGTIPPNPAELLYSERLDELVADLRNSYDYIIFDCPPAEIVADTKIVSRLTDLTIFIIRAGIFDRSMLAEVQKYYDEKTFGPISVILNGTDDPTTSFVYRSNRYG
ncbi:MAG: polysaccharide biosynthesis tyrosine autokinase, partial [Muribaculaceae bacterium]|nr:polysaccharide biosynthesis tyrosine autokinase [Muribaculaceae bacterium]